MPSGECSRHHGGDDSVTSSPSKTQANLTHQDSDLNRKSDQNGDISNPSVTVDSNPPAYNGDNPRLNESQSQSETDCDSPEANGRRVFSTGPDSNGVGSHVPGPPDAVNRNTTPEEGEERNDHRVEDGGNGTTSPGQRSHQSSEEEHQQRERCEDQEDSDAGSRTVHTFRKDGEIVRISGSGRTSGDDPSEETDIYSESESGTEENMEDGSRTENDADSRKDTKQDEATNGDTKQDEATNEDTGNDDASNRDTGKDDASNGVTGNDDASNGAAVQSESSEESVLESPVQDPPVLKRGRPSQELEYLKEASATLEATQSNLQVMFARVRVVLDHYHGELDANTLAEYIMEAQDLQDSFRLISAIYRQCEGITEIISKDLKGLRLTTNEVYNLLKQKFREEDLTTWVAGSEDQTLDHDRLREERVAKEKTAIEKAAQARLALAIATSDVSESHEIVAQAEIEAAEAEVVAKKARAVAEDAFKSVQEARRAAEQKHKAEVEARRKALEKSKLRKEEEKRRKEEEELVLAEEAKKKGTSLEEEKKRVVDEKEAIDAERKNLNNWPRYIYSIDSEDFASGIGCIIRAIDGSLSRDDVEVTRLEQSSGVLTLCENEELIGNIVQVEPTDKEKVFQFEEAFSLALPHCAPRSHPSREPVIKMLQEDGDWTELPTSEVSFPDIKDLRFVESRIQMFGTFTVVYSIKKDSLEFVKSGGKIASTVDARVTMTSKPLGFRFNTSCILQVQPVDSTMISDLRSRIPECESILSCSPIVYMEISHTKFQKPIAVTLPVPPQQSRIKRPVTSIPRDNAASATNDQRPATAKPKATLLKPEDEKATDDLHLLQRLPDGSWAKVAKVVMVQAKDIVTFEISRPLERFFIMRTKLDVSTALVDEIAGILNEAITQRTVQFFMRQITESPADIVVSCGISSRLDRALKRFEDDGYDYGPKPGPEVLMTEGQVMSLRFRGNLLPEDDVIPDVLVFNSHLPCQANFRMRIVDTFAQKCLENYRGFVQLFTGRMEAHEVPSDEDVRDTMRGTSQKTQPKFIMVLVDTLISELLIRIPKPEPEPPKPLITAPLLNVPDGPVDKDVLLHIAEELGDEWIKLAGYLNVKHSRIQAILRQNYRRDSTRRKYDMLLTWSKRLPRSVDRVEILSRGLTNNGRGDLAEELRERRNEFRRQRLNSCRDSHMRKAFVKVARDQGVVTDWQSLALKLGLSKMDVEEIERMRPTSQDRCFSSLQRWMELNGDDATLKTLSRSLRTCRHRGLARDIESIA